MAKCENCAGSGVITHGAVCHLCNGTAEVIIYEDDGSESLVNCSNCYFGLVYVEDMCRYCRGTGEVA
jgi:DnaJ-class molecular chaperone